MAEPGPQHPVRGRSLPGALLWGSPGHNAHTSRAGAAGEESRGCDWFDAKHGAGRVLLGSTSGHLGHRAGWQLRAEVPETLVQAAPFRITLLPTWKTTISSKRKPRAHPCPQPHTSPSTPGTGGCPKAPKNRPQGGLGLQGLLAHLPQPPTPEPRPWGQQEHSGTLSAADGQGSCSSTAVPRRSQRDRNTQLCRTGPEKFGCPEPGQQPRRFLTHLLK